jgi:hypothetical protein
MEFRWNWWNVEHIGVHGVSPDEAEWIVAHARRPYPRYEGGGKFKVRGQSEHGRYLQVIYIFDPGDVVYVVHSRPLNDREKRAERRRMP